MSECGIDIVEIERIRSAVKSNERFLAKVFSEKEIEYFRTNGERFESLAGFYAAKEAFAKYKKTGIRGFELSEISVEHEKNGAPFVVFRGERMSVSLSISHDRTHAVAVVCGAEKAVSSCCAEMGDLIPDRKSDAHKGDCGKVFIVAGSEGMTGAAVLCARGAMRCGAGLVTVGTAASERHIVAASVAEPMTVALDACDGIITCKALERILEFAKKSDAVIFGPGLGRNSEIHTILRELLEKYEGKLVIDADGLFALGEDCSILKNRKCSVVLTPHVGEMSRISGLSAQEIQKNRQKTAEDFALKYGVCVLLKGKGTVVAEKGQDCRVYVNTTGNAGMATGGSGDVLSGVIGAYLAQGLSAFDAAKLGAYIHGKAGDIAAEEYGIHGLVAGDIADKLPLAVKSELTGRKA